MIRNILVAYDGSASAEQALDFAVALGKAFGARLHVLSVVRPPDFGEEVETRALVEQGRERAAKVLEAARRKLAGAQPAPLFHLAVGHPAEQVVRYAEDKGVDHIVVGHRGHTLFERWLIGSVARQVIAYAPCAVTVVRQPAGG